MNALKAEGFLELLLHVGGFKMNLTKLLCKYCDEYNKGYVTVGDIL